MQAEQIFLVNNGIKNVDMLANEYLELGKLLGSQQKPEQAIQSFGASIRLRPHHSFEAYTNLGIIYHNHKADEAEHSYRKAIQLASLPASALTAMFNLGALYANQQGRVAEAKPIFEQILVLAPDHLQAHGVLEKLVQMPSTDSTATETVGR